MPRKFPHEKEEQKDEGDDEELPEEEEEHSEDSRNPISAIFAIIDRYYEGLKREKEGMGVD